MSDEDYVSHRGLQYADLHTLSVILAHPARREQSERSV
jgi:hypothetical protein